MDYELKLGNWNSVFAIPCSLVDKYMNEANIDQLRVLLWVLRNSGKEIDAKKACEDLKISFYKFNQCFDYWLKKGFFSLGFSKETETHLANKNVAFSGSSNESTSRYRRPDAFHVAARIKESQEISLLMHEAEAMLGRIISSVDSAILLMLHDNQGLPVDVILMLIQYSVSIGKHNLKYIEKMGMDWAESGIDSVNKAEDKIQSLNHHSMIWNKFQSLIGIERRSCTSFEEKILAKWYDEWKLNDNLIKYAYEVCVDAKGKYAIRYMDGILKKWCAQKIFTVKQAKNFQKLYRNEKSCSDVNGVSYNIEEYENYNIFSSK